MSSRRFLWLFVALFMVFTQGFWERILLLPPGSSLIIEIPIWFYLGLSSSTFNKDTPGHILVIIYVFFVCLTGLLNQSEFVTWIKYTRFFLYFYLIYQSLWSTPVTSKQWRLILKFVIFLILLQGFGSAYNIFILNQRVEGHVGLMSSLGGTTASTFPLVVISSSSVIFIFARRQGVKFILYLTLIVICAVFVGYASGKRAIFFTIPLFLMITFLISYLQLKRNRTFYKKIVVIGLVIVFTIPVYLFGITTSHGLNYNLTGNESKMEVVAKAIDYVHQYEESTSLYGKTTGRTGTTFQILNKSTVDLYSFVVGSGYGSIKEEKTLHMLGVNYGIVGFTRDIISGGWLVMILTVLILSKVILSNRSINFKSTKALRLVLFAGFLFTHFTYSSDFTVHLKITFLLAILCAFINAPTHRRTLNIIISHYFYSAVSKRKHYFLQFSKIS